MPKTPAINFQPLDRGGGPVSANPGKPKDYRGRHGFEGKKNCMGCNVMRILEQLGFGPRRFHTRTDDGGWLVEVEPPEWSGFAKSEIKLSDYQFERYQRWLDGDGLIQERLPDLTNAEREILMSGIGDKDFNRMFDD